MSWSRWASFSNNVFTAEASKHFQDLAEHARLQSSRAAIELSISAVSLSTCRGNFGEAIACRLLRQMKSYARSSVP